ncbi:MAG: sigma factor [Acetivibrio sp.]
MLDKSKFMEMLKDLTELAAIDGNRLTQKEVQEYFKDMDIKEEQFNHIYAYLIENHVHITDGDTNLDEMERTNEEKGNTLKEEDSIFLKMYLKDLQTLEKLSKEEEEVVFRETKNRIPGAKERLIHGWLPKVVKIAKKYKDNGVLLEDLIQEGNIGLLRGVDMIPMTEDDLDLEEYLKEAIEWEILQIIDEEVEEEDLENTVMGRTNLIQEAAKYLAEDLGRVATVGELSEYTKLSIEEITDTIKLSLDAVKLGKGE